MVPIDRTRVDHTRMPRPIFLFSLQNPFPMKRNWRTKNIGATTDIIKGGVVITIDILQPIAGDLMDHGHRDIIGSIRTNIGMTKVQKMNGSRRHITKPGTHHGITRGSNQTRMNLQ